MSPTLFTLRLASGEVVVTHVHGSGGAMSGADAEQRLRLQIRRANDGRPLQVYEPQLGHVRPYRQTAKADVDERMLDLRGAEVLEVVS